ncbi:unnamed protein product [Caenorhabditis angaria]|uniref:Uncharacterized protein n=1 Tax=Caenorhabditis angaria TaxID=860376 RepID=A0A9P1IIZ6_9PELO|nr:unnamed protein product [Caenorhabditis angaria]
MTNLKKIRKSINTLLIGWFQLSIIFHFEYFEYKFDCQIAGFLAFFQILTSLTFLAASKTYISLHLLCQLIIFIGCAFKVFGEFMGWFPMWHDELAEINLLFQAFYIFCMTKINKTNLPVTHDLNNIRKILNTYLIFAFFQLSIFLTFATEAYQTQSYKYMILALLQVEISILFILKAKFFIVSHLICQIIFFLYYYALHLIKFLTAADTAKFNVFEHSEHLAGFYTIFQIFYMFCVFQHIVILVEKTEAKSEEEQKLFENV